MAKKGRLGTGLGELLGEIGGSYEKALNNQQGFVAEVIEVRVDMIRPNPMQPRKVFDEQALQELSASIQEHGLLQPILLCEDSSNNEHFYILIAGERRWRASKIAGFERIKAIILDDIKPQQLRQIALIENLQREDLNPVEIAKCYKELIEEHHLTHEALAQKISKSRAQITNTLRILSLREDILEMITTNKISQGHAKILVGLDDEEQQRIAALIIEKGLSVRETEDLTRSFKNKATQNVSMSTTVLDYEHELQTLMNLLIEKGVKVKKNKNQLQLFFENKESVAQLIEKIQ